MRGGVLIVVVGLLLLYLGLSGHYRPFVKAFREVAGLGEGDVASANGAVRPTSQQITYADLLRPLELPGSQQEPYSPGVFG